MDSVFLKIFNMGIAAGWMALAVILLRLLFRRMPRRLFCLLWGLVAVRLICPFSVESMLSLMPSARTVPQDIMYMNEPAIHTGIAYLNSAVNPVLSEVLAPVPGDSVNPLQIFSAIAWNIWICGVGAMMLYAVVSWASIRKRAAVSMVLEDNIYLCDYIDTPFILGIFRPKIYLPSSLEEGRRVHVIAHEKAHLKSRDHWWKPLGFALLSVYWFHPVLWIAYILLGRDLELACDEKVITELGESEKKAYSETLLFCSTLRRRITACPLAFGEVGVKERVKSVLRYKKPAFWIVAVGIVACIAVGICFLTNPKEAHNPGEEGIVITPGQTGGEGILQGLGSADSVAYVSSFCLYLNPLSSALAMGDSGEIYEFQEDAFVIRDSSTGLVQEELETDWQWEDFPYTDEEWNAFFVPGGFGGLLDLSTRYEKIRYLHLSDKYRLIMPNGELWLAQMNHNPQMGRYIWCIYSLVPRDSMGSAVWEYNPYLSSQIPAFPMEFDIEGAKITAFCDEGTLIDYDNPDGTVQDAGLTIPGDRRLYWSPLNQESDVLYAGAAKIMLHIEVDNIVQPATVYITGVKGENASRVYTARLVGGNMFMDQNEETFGAVISLKASE